MEDKLVRTLIDSIVDYKTARKALSEVWRISYKDVMVTREILHKASYKVSEWKLCLLILELVSLHTNSGGELDERTINCVLTDVKDDFNYEMLVDAMYDERIDYDSIYPVTVLQYARKMDPRLSVKEILEHAREVLTEDPVNQIAKDVIEFLTTEDV